MDVVRVVQAHASACDAQALFGRLPADEAVKEAFAALMHEIATFGEQRDGIFARIAKLGPEELACRRSGPATSCGSRQTSSIGMAPRLAPPCRTARQQAGRMAGKAQRGAISEAALRIDGGAHFGIVCAPSSFGG